MKSKITTSLMSAISRITVNGFKRSGTIERKFNDPKHPTKNYVTNHWSNPGIVQEVQ